MQKHANEQHIYVNEVERIKEVGHCLSMCLRILRRFRSVKNRIISTPIFFEGFGILREEEDLI